MGRPTANRPVTTRVTAGSDPSGLDRRALRPDDAVSLVGLSGDAGWNQTEDDWRLMLELGEGFGYWQSETPVATALILPYGSQFAWLSMVLVAEAWRRQGLASRLTEVCLKRARALGLALRLDATDTGRAVYRRFGFTDQYTFTRFAADRPTVGNEATADVRTATVDDLDAIAAYDAASFGAGRKAVLTALLKGRSSLGWVSDANDACAGFVLGRDGCRAIQFGPLVADDTPTAIALAAAALRDLRERVFVDVIDGRDDFLSWLAEAGFVPQRQFTRMSLDEPAFDPPPASFVVAGPEFG